MSEAKTNLWIPTLLGVAFLLVGVLLPKVWDQLPGWVTPTSYVVAFAAWALAAFLSHRRGRGRGRGGEGGIAKAVGPDSQAYGGKGGDAGSGRGGDGGAAIAKGARSTAKGGAGGRG